MTQQNVIVSSQILILRSLTIRGTQRKITRSMFTASYGKYVLFSVLNPYNYKLDKVYQTRGDMEIQR